jgi:S1-C subfamily serine protease
MIVLAVGLYAGFMLKTYEGGTPQVTLYDSRISALESEVAGLSSQVAALQSGSLSGNLTAYQSPSLNGLYESVKDSVVTIEGLDAQTGLLGTVSYTEVLGSGFVVNLTGTPLIVTNYHVIDGMINGSVTFINGSAYPFTVLGTDPYSDLAVLQPQAPASLLKPLPVVSSQTLEVGDTVIAVGNPYGLQSTLTSGIVSQLNRAIQTNSSGNYLIAGLIQISTPINPGNSGSPLFDTEGNVVGITNAIISGSNNVGFAVPSDALLREIYALTTTGTYEHPYLGISGVPLDYLTAQAAGLNITSGVLIQSVVAGSPAANAGLLGGSQTANVGGTTIAVGGDVIIQANNQTIRTMDDLTSYLEEYTAPGQTVNFTVVRGENTLVIPVVLGVRS